MKKRKADRAAAYPAAAPLDKPAPFSDKTAPQGITECLVGRDSVFEGRLSASGFLRVEGSCAGEIAAPGSLVIARGASAKAVITAADIVVAGRVEGSIRASRSVHLTSTAEVLADICSPLFRLDEGARFSGEVSQPASLDEAD